MSDSSEKSDSTEREGKYELARKIAVRKVGFIRHATVYVIVMVALAVINNTTWGGYQWWLWPALGWGIGVVSHFFQAFLFQSGGLVDQVARREMEKMDEKK
jgi:hypothetical protein